MTLGSNQVIVRNLSHTVNTPGPHLMLIDIVRNSTSATIGKNPNIYLMRIYSTSANEKHCEISKNSPGANFALSE